MDYDEPMDSDDELDRLLDAALGRQIGNAPQVVNNYQNAFGSADANLTQQWIDYGLGQRTNDVNAIVRSGTEDVEMESDDGGEDEDVPPPIDSGYTVANFPKDSRVVLINIAESFYGAVGTVRGKGSRTGTVSVEFDTKQGVRYNVPAAHLEPYLASDQVTGLLAGSNGLWTFNGLPSLVRFLQAKESENGRWAFTGGVALSYWAREYGVPFRHPEDMDIVVANLNAWYYDLELAVTGEPGRPTMTANHRTVYLNMGKVDIIADGEGLGDFGAGPYMIGGVPVVGLDTIGHYKRKRNEDKDKDDLKVLDRILRLKNNG